MVGARAARPPGARRQGRPRQRGHGARAGPRADSRRDRRGGRAPTRGESGERVAATPEQVLEAREAAGAYRAVSLDRPRNEEDEEGELVDAFGSEDPGFELAEDAATVQRLMRVLSEREREVLRLRFEEDLTQSEIGDIVG